jgi:hypothetical protein
MILLCVFSVFGAEYVVIVNPANSMESINSAMLRRYYTGRASDIDGKRAVPINYKLDSPISQSFMEDIMRQSPGEYQQDWVDRQIRGEGTAPMVQNSVDAVMGMVNTVPGAIGYIPTDQADDRVKIIEVE